MQCRNSKQLRLLRLALLTGLLLCSGCVNQQIEGTATVYRSSIGVAVFAVIFGLLCCAFGIWLLRHPRGNRWILRTLTAILFVLGIGLPTILLRTVLHESVHIDTEEFVINARKTGYRPEIRIRYNEVAQVTAYAQRKQRSTGYSRFWLVVDFKDGRQEELTVNDLLTAALPQLREKLSQHNVPLKFPENLPP